MNSREFPLHAFQLVLVAKKRVPHQRDAITIDNFPTNS